MPDLWVCPAPTSGAPTPRRTPGRWHPPDYIIEGTFLGKYISENYPGKKVAILYQNDDFGSDGLAGVKKGLDPSKNQLVSEQTYESTAVAIRSQVTNMKQAGRRGRGLACTPGYTAQAIKAPTAWAGTRSS